MIDSSLKSKRRVKSDAAPRKDKKQWPCLAVAQNSHKRNSLDQTFVGAEERDSYGEILSSGERISPRAVVSLNVWLNTNGFLPVLRRRAAWARSKGASSAQWQKRDSREFSVVEWEARLPQEDCARKHKLL
jgi:hypothetical protein